tara:strand:- start:96 stop:572 length:477 start_codon:yes stop_codon:yes gene_type:complete
MKPLVSIGMPMRNGFINKTEKDINLKKALNSILNQSYKNIKIILSNNGSTDEVNKFLNEISKKDNIIKVYNQNQEMFINNNFVFVLSKTTDKYFKWNGADDIIYPILLFYEFRIDFLGINFFSEELTLFKKIILLFTCIKVNLSFVKIKYQNKLENEK